MRLIAFGAAAILAVAALSGCTTTGGKDVFAEIDSAIQQSLPQVCKAAATAQPAIQVAEAGGQLTGQKAAAVDAAYASLAPICADPSKQTAATVLVAATTAYLTISTALKHTQAKAPS